MLLAQTETSARCTVMPKMGCQAASQQIDLQPFKFNRDEIGLESGGELESSPAKLQSGILQSLHMEHPGITLLLLVEWPE